MKEGWLCPRCKKVNAPWVSQCTCNETITTNIPVTGDPQFTWLSNLDWITCCDKAPTAVYSSDKNSSTTKVCNCSNRTESLNGKSPN